MTAMVMTAAWMASEISAFRRAVAITPSADQVVKT